MSKSWVEKAQAELIRQRGRAPAWSYRNETAPAVEPTVLACLGLVASERGPDCRRLRDECRRSADWLTSMQCRDGSLGVLASVSSPGWPTPYGILLWAALDGYTFERERAVCWLLAEEGVAVPNLSTAERTVGHDTTIVGWPWVADTHSWLEPTAAAVLALRRMMKSGHPRVCEGLRLIRNRAIATGGWNYGNNHAFGRELRPQPGPSGLALLALAGLEGRAGLVEQALSYLQETLPTTRAPQSLCWGVLALRAWGCCPETADAWLAEAFEQALHQPDPGARPAYLLLAAGADSLELLGLAPARGTAP